MVPSGRPGIRRLIRDHLTRVGHHESPGQSKIHHLHQSVSTDEDVPRFDIAMNDPLRVRRGQRLRHLQRNVR
jgi:hypothetical protein